MKLDAGTIAALVVAGTGLVTVLLQWRSGAGRARTYNRLGQLLTMRGNVPDVLPSIRDVLDAEIVRVADRLGPVHIPVDVEFPPRERERAITKKVSYPREVYEALRDAGNLVVTWISLGIAVLGFSYTLTTRGRGLWIDIAITAMSLGFATTHVLDAAKHVRMYHRPGGTNLPAVPERTEGGTPA